MPNRMRHGNEDRGADGSQILSKVFYGAGVGHGAAGHHGDVVAHGPFKGVGEGQEGKENVVGAGRDAFKHCFGVPEDVAVGEHDAFGRPRGAGGVDDGGEGVRLVGRGREGFALR
jgi:hypothetical protein